MAKKNSKKYVTVADLMEVLAKVENPTETLIGVPRRNGYGEKYYTPTTEVIVNPNEKIFYLKSIMSGSVEILPLDYK